MDLKIGIFWYSRQELISFSTHVNEIEPNSQGVFDYHQGHHEIWESVKEIDHRYRYWEYDEVPRGRVLAKNTPDGIRAIVYSSERIITNPRARAKLIEEFNLGEDTIWETDTHYGDPRNVFWGTY